MQRRSCSGVIGGLQRCAYGRQLTTSRLTTTSKTSWRERSFVKETSCFSKKVFYQPSRLYSVPKLTFEFDEIHHALDQHIQTNLRTEATAEEIRDSQFAVCFLGTSGNIPTKQKMQSATVLRLGGVSYLFDAGEGLQRQLQHTRITPKSIRKIFITHLHGDHIFGLPSLLLQLQGSQVERDPSARIDIYGPPGIFNYIASTLALTQAVFVAGRIVVHELVGGDADQARKRKKQKQMQKQEQQQLQRIKDVHTGHYPELTRRNLFRKYIPRNADGTWTISSLSPDNKSQYSVAAAEVNHLSLVQTFGYVVKEAEPLIKIDVEKAKALGLRPSPKYKHLQRGEPVKADDGETVIYPRDVMADEKTKRARKFGIVGDNCEISRAMQTLLQDADVLIHEATLTDDLSLEADARGHSSADMAGKVAREARAKLLVLNHMGQQFNLETTAEYVERAQKENKGTSHVLAAHDFMEIVVPFKGFDSPSTTDTNTD